MGAALGVRHFVTKHVPESVWCLDHPLGVDVDSRAVVRGIGQRSPCNCFHHSHIWILDGWMLSEYLTKQLVCERIGSNEGHREGQNRKEGLDARIQSHDTYF